MESSVRADVVRLVINQVADGQLVYLRERGGRQRTFPIVIGVVEALAMHRALNKERPPRPMTHELVYRLIDGLGAKVRRVTVSELRDNTFYAILSIEVDGKHIEVDARPSDALTLAVHYGAPVFVSESVFREAGEAPQ